MFCVTDVLGSLFVNLHHLRVSLGLSALPFNPAAPIVPGTPEHSMQRCLEGVHSIYEVGFLLLSPFFVGLRC